PHIASAIGAVATQALLNPFYGVNGIRLLREGFTAEEVLRALITPDPGREQRQVHIMDASGAIAVHTGSECVGWCGHMQGEDCWVAGNVLARARVVGETAAAFVANAALPFPRRLIAALKAGEAAGGDKRGKQSAALRIHTEEEWSDLDLRVDDHVDPLAELARLEAVGRGRWMHFRKFLPNRHDPVGTLDRDVIDAEIARLVAAETMR